VANADQGRDRRCGPETVPTFRVGDSPVRVRNTHHPARLRAVHQATLQRRNERKLGDLSSVRALLYIAVLVREFPLHSRAPGRLLNAATPLLAGVGRVLGLRIS